MKDYSQTASQILEKIGTDENIGHFEHCSTRLRFSLKDNSKADIEGLKKVPGVMAVITGPQTQVVIGNDVVEVYDKILEQANITNSGSDSTQSQDQSKWFEKLMDFIIGIFQPLVPPIAGAGILKSLLSVFTSFGLLTTDNIFYVIMFNAADAALYFLPLIVAVSVANKMKVNWAVALAVVAMPLLPVVTDTITEGASILGITLQQIQYSYQVFPAILTTLFYAYLERAITKISPKPVRIFLVPMLCFLICAPVELIILGPLGFNIGTLITQVILFLYNTIGWLAVGLLAAILPFMVATGMHKALLPYAITSITTTGMESLYMSASLAHNISEGGASLAVALKTKDEDLKATAVSAGISGVFGITEPALYGVTLQNRIVLICICISSFFSGIFLGLLHVKAFAAVGPGLASMPMFIDPNDSMNLVWAGVGFAISLIASFVLTYFFWKPDTPAEVAEREEIEAKETGTPDSNIGSSTKPTNIVSPMTGKVVKLENVPDEVFATGVLGQGAAVEPIVGELRAPADGTIANVFGTKHAVTLVTDKGAEMLMHIGMDTVNLNGEGFTAHVKDGQKVKAGDLLVTFDLEGLKNKGFEIITPIVVTNMDQFDITDISEGNIQNGDGLYKIEVKK